MVKFSIKQLLRQPGKAILFFLLMAASTALVVSGAIMTIENTQRIQTVEDTYTTVGYIGQLPVSVDSEIKSDPCMGMRVNTTENYGDTILPGDLLFPGANYIVKPEYRPYYVSYLPDLHATRLHGYLKRHILEFTPLEDSEDGHMVDVQITKVLFSNVNPTTLGMNNNDHDMKVGDVFPLCQECSADHVCPLKVGERYVSTISNYSGDCPEHGEEYWAYVAPHSSQYDAQGNYIGYEGFFTEGRVTADGEPLTQRDAITRVTGDHFYEEGQPGNMYMKWVEIYEKEDCTFTTLPINSLELLSDWHEGIAKTSTGREITPEEFETGAAVCMVPQEFATINQLRVGDKINLPFLCSYYGDTSWSAYQGSLPYEFSLFDANGDWYEPFWEQEYEIVGIYSDYLQSVWIDTFIIPAKSVGASDENNIANFDPMTKKVASFQIPNGTITKFDAALKAAVPGSEYLDITYDDRGYSEIMKSLNTSRNMAFLLLLAGVLAALAIVALLLYFFVAKEKKRTAIERSLGMTKRQCRVSLLAGLMVLTVAATGLGSLGGVVALDRVQASAEPAASSSPSSSQSIIGAPSTAIDPDELDRQYTYDTRYSLWAKNRILAENAEIEAEAPGAVYFAVPLSICLLVLVLALALLARSFHIDPIYLLSSKGKE